MPIAEMLVCSGNHGVFDMNVVIRNIGHIDIGGVSNNHVINYTGAAPSAPPRSTDETGFTPPGFHRLTPAKCYPTHSRTSHAGWRP